MGTRDEMFPPEPKWTPADIPDDVAGKVAVVTGANSGIGAETVLQLLKKDVTVVLVCRSETKAKAAMDLLRTKTDKGKMIFVQCDLGHIQGVRDAAKEIISKVDLIHMLFANAGVMAPPPNDVTQDGYELQMGCNVIGHYVLITELLPLLQKTAQSLGDPKLNAVRVVITSSVGHRLFGPKEGFRLRDPELKSSKARFIPGAVTWRRYGHSKMGNILMANKLNRLHGAEGIVFSSVHPGNLKTELTRHTPAFMARVFSRFFLYPAELGCYTQLYAATAPEGADFGGVYLSAWARVYQAEKIAYDHKPQDELWTWLGEQAALH